MTDGRGRMSDDCSLDRHVIRGGGDFSAHGERGKMQAREWRNPGGHLDLTGGELLRRPPWEGNLVEKRSFYFSSKVREVDSAQGGMEKRSA